MNRKAKQVVLSDYPKQARRSREALNVSKPIQYPDHLADAIAESKEMFKPFSKIVDNPSATLLFLESMQTAAKDETLGTGANEYPIWKDPQTGQQCHARIIGVRWLAKTKTRLGESYQKMDIAPANFVETLKEAGNTAIDKMKLKESQRAKLREDYDNFDGNYPTNPQGWPGIGYLAAGDKLPMPPGPLTHQLYLQDMWQQQAKAFQMYNHFGIAKGIIKTLAAFVIGDGAKVSPVIERKLADKNKSDATEEQEDQLKREAEDVWHEFEKRTNFQVALPQNCEMLSKNGELLWHIPEIKVEGKMGFCDFISKSPGTCWEIITKPDDIRDVQGYYFNYPTRYMIIQKDDLPTTDYIVDMVAPDEMVHITINTEADEVRGRSDLYASLSDLKLLYDILKARAVKVMNSAGIMIHHKITGNLADINNIANTRMQSGGLGLGTEIYTSESEEIEVFKGADSERSKSGLHDEMMSAIGTGTGLPADWIGSGGSGSRAAALTRTEPAAKLVRRRQKELEQAIKDVYKRVIQVAKKSGGLSEDAPEDCEVTFSEIAPENLKDKITLIAMGEQQEWLTHEQAVKMYQKEMDITDAPDYEALMEQIKTDKQDKALAQLDLPMQINPDTGQPMPPKQAPEGGAGPITPGGPTSGNAKGKAQSKGAYNGDAMGLSNDSKKSIKKSLQAFRLFNPHAANQLIEWAKKDAAPVTKTPEPKPVEKKGKKALGAGLKSRTKSTLSAEAISQMAPFVRKGAKKIESLKDLAKHLYELEHGR